MMSKTCGAEYNKYTNDTLMHQDCAQKKGKKIKKYLLYVMHAFKSILEFMCVKSTMQK